MATEELKIDHENGTAEVNAIDEDGLKSRADVKAGTMDAAALTVQQGHGVYDLVNHHGDYPGDKTNAEIAYFPVAAGEKVEVTRLAVGLKGGGTNANIVLEAYDFDDGSVMASVTGGKVESGDSPIGTSKDGSDVTFRLSTPSSPPDFTLVASFAVVPV